MSKSINLDKKLVEFREILKKYNGVIPAQNVDRTAYAALTYCLNKYGDSPQMQQLKSEFPQMMVKKHDSYSERVAKVTSYLEEYGSLIRLPN